MGGRGRERDTGSGREGGERRGEKGAGGEGEREGGAYANVCVCVYIHTYIHACIHTYIHTPFAVLDYMQLFFRTAINFEQLHLQLQPFSRPGTSCEELPLQLQSVFRFGISFGRVTVPGLYEGWLFPSPLPLLLPGLAPSVPPSVPPSFPSVPLSPHHSLALSILCSFAHLPRKGTHPHAPQPSRVGAFKRATRGHLE